MVPFTYFFFPETAYRSLEEMDVIFNKTTSVFDLVRVARDEPRRYGKNGEMLIDYHNTDEHKRVVGAAGGRDEKQVLPGKEQLNPAYSAEGGQVGHLEHANDSTNGRSE